MKTAEKNWLPVWGCIEFKIARLCYRVVHDFAPIYLSELVLPHQPHRSVCSETCVRHFLLRPQYFDRNDLPSSLQSRYMPSDLGFKLFRKHIPTLTRPSCCCYSPTPTHPYLCVPSCSCIANWYVVLVFIWLWQLHQNTSSPTTPGLLWIHRARLFF